MAKDKREQTLKGRGLESKRTRNPSNSDTIRGVQRQISSNKAKRSISIEKSKKTSISSGMNKVSLQGRASRLLSNEVFEASANNGPKSDLSNFLIDELGEFLDREGKVPRIIDELVPEPVQIEGEFVTNVTDKVPCDVLHSSSNRSWGGTRRVRAESGSDGDLFFWKLSSTVTSNLAFIFGMEAGGEMKYVSSQGSGLPLRFISHDVHPMDVDLDVGEEKDDPRAFYTSPDSLGLTGGEFLIPAMYDSLAARIDGSNVVTDPLDQFTDTWFIEER